jgi:hypothetical protein
MGGSRFGRPYDKTKLVAPSLIDEGVLEVLRLAVGLSSAPAQALQDLRARRERGEDVVCLIDDRDIFVIPRADLPPELADTIKI